MNLAPLQVSWESISRVCFRINVERETLTASEYLQHDFWFRCVRNDWMKSASTWNRHKVDDIDRSSRVAESKNSNSKIDFQMFTKLTTYKNNFQNWKFIIDIGKWRISSCENRSFQSIFTLTTPPCPASLLPEHLLFLSRSMYEYLSKFTHCYFKTGSPTIKRLCLGYYTVVQI